MSWKYHKKLKNVAADSIDDNVSNEIITHSFN